MTHTIIVTLSEAAQRNAILAGEPAERTQSFEVSAELLPKLLALPWTQVDHSGSARCDVPAELHWSQKSEEGDEPVTAGNSYIHTIASHARGWHTEACHAEVRPADAAGAIWYAEDAIRVATEHLLSARDKRRKELAARAETERQAAAEWSVLPLAERAEDVRKGVTSYRGADLRSLAAEAYAEAQREEKRLREEAESSLLNQRRSIVVGHGSEEQLERFDAGVLPEEEFSLLAETYLFARFSVLPHFVELTEADLDHRADCTADPEDVVRFGSSRAEKTTFDADEWSAIKCLQTVAGDDARVDVAVRQHRAHCRHCEAETFRYGVRVTIEYAGEKYSREYAI